MSDDQDVDVNADPELENPIRNCTSTRCVTCIAGILNLDPEFCSKLTGESFRVSDSMDCKTSHCVYLICCKHPGCEMQYVGQTICTVAKRMSSHKSSIRTSKGCKILSEHFTQVHSLEDMSITLIELLDQSLNLKEREIIEEGWMKRLNTLYPYGLNVRAKTCGVMDAVSEVENSKTVIYSKFDRVIIRRHARGSRQQRLPSNFDAEQFVRNLVDCDAPSLRNIRTKVTQLNTEKVKLVYLASIHRLKNSESVHILQLLRVVKDLSLFKCKAVWDKTKAAMCNQFLVVKFVNKFVEDVGLSKILMDPNIKCLSPLNGQAAAPTVSYKYLPSIRSQIVNYRQTHLENLDANNMTCECDSSAFKNSHHQHVVTGSLDIVGNIELRNLLKKGLNYRDQAPPNKTKTLTAVKDGLNSYIKKKSSKNSVPESMFSEWRDAVITSVKDKLDRFTPYSYNAALLKPAVSEELSRLQEKFVFVPTDKASNTVSIVCKKIYVQLHHDEINSNTYQPSTESPEEISVNLRKSLSICVVPTTFSDFKKDDHKPGKSSFSEVSLIPSI